MATPITAARFVTIARAAGIPLVLHEGWRTRNRDKAGAWGPVHGVMLHHTVTRDLRSTLPLVRDTGVPGVPPPLYNGVVDEEGLLHMIGWGRANHAGRGDDDVLRAVIAEQPLPPDNESNTDGNARFYGFSGINMGDGKDPWSQRQLETLGKVAGVICEEHGWSERSVIGHLEWQPGKIDPRGPQGSLMGPLRLIARGALR